MWPWMRDLPTSVWAGHGWAFDENGLRRLSSSGGSHAMQGVEVFESVGLAEEEVKPSGGKIKETPAAVAAAENPPPPSEEQKPNKFARNNIAKQSGVAGVLWNRSAFAWEVQIPKSDSKGKRIGKTNRTFSVKKFIGPGISEAQADAAALAAAEAFRAELVEKGILSEPRQKDPKLHQRSAGGVVVQELQKVGGADPPQGRQESDPRRLLHREGGGRGQGLGAPGEGRPAAPGEARGYAVGAAGVPPQGALPRGEVGRGGSSCGMPDSVLKMVISG